MTMWMLSTGLIWSCHALTLWLLDILTSSIKTSHHFISLCIIPNKHLSAFVSKNIHTPIHTHEIRRMLSRNITFLLSIPYTSLIAYIVKSVSCIRSVCTELQWFQLTLWNTYEYCVNAKQNGEDSYLPRSLACIFSSQNNDSDHASRSHVQQ